MNFKKDRQRLFVFCLAILLVASLFLNIGKVPLNFEEPRRSLIAIEMMISGNYAVPTVNGAFYYNKPPVFNWVLAAMYHLTDSYDEWISRSVTVLSFLGIALLLFRVVQIHINRRVAVLAAFFWLTSTHIYFHSSLLGEIDLFYTLLLFVQVVAIFHFFERKKYGSLFLVSYVFMALGILTKGLPSFLFQSLTLIAVFGYHKRFKELMSVAHIVGAVSGFAIISSYFFIYAQYNDPVNFLFNLTSESTDRSLLSQNLWESIKHLFLFPFSHLHILLPWAVFGLLFFERRVRKNFFDNTLLCFSLLFIIVNIIPYWLSPGTRDRYLYVFVPFAMIILAQVVDRFYLTSKLKLAFDGLFLLLGIALCLAPLAFPFLDGFKEIPNIRVISVSFSLLFVALIVLFIRKSRQRMGLVLVMLIGARFMYNVTVIPYKVKTASERRPYREMVEDIIQLADGKQVYAFGPVNEKEIDLPFLGQASIESPEVPYFLISFYYSVISGEILRFTDKKKRGVLHLSEQSLVPEGESEILKTYYIIELGETYTLFRFKN